MHSVRRGAALLEPLVALGVAAYTALPWLEAVRDAWWLPGLVMIGFLAAAGLAGLLGARVAVVAMLRAGLAIAVLVVVSGMLPDRSLTFALWFCALALVYPLVLPFRMALPTVVLIAIGLGSGAFFGKELLGQSLATAGTGLALVIGAVVMLVSRSAEEPIPEKPVPAPKPVEDLIAVAFDTAASGLALLDAEGRVVRANRALADMLGRSPEGMTGVSWWGQVSPDDVRSQQAKFEQLLAGQIWSFHAEAKLRTRNQRLIWAVVGMSMVAGASGDPHRVFVQVANIDERVRRELKLRERVSGSRRSFERAPVPMWEVGLDDIVPALERWRRERVDDLAGYLQTHAELLRHTVANLELRDVNEAAKKLVGAEDRDDFLRGVRSGRLGPGFEEGLASQLGALWKGRTSDVHRVDLHDFAGGEHSGLLEMAVLEERPGEGASSMLVGFTDLSDLLEERKALDAVAARLHSVVAAAPVILFATDAFGLFTLFEGRAVEYLGLAPGEVVGRSVFEVYRDAGTVVSSMRRALEGESFSAPADLGDCRFEIRYSPVFEEGRVAGVIGLAWNVGDLPLSPELEPTGGDAAENRAWIDDATDTRPLVGPENESASSSAEDDQAVVSPLPGEGGEELVVSDEPLSALWPNELDDESASRSAGDDLAEVWPPGEEDSEPLGSSEDDSESAWHGLLEAFRAPEAAGTSPPAEDLAELDRILGETGETEEVADDLPEIEPTDLDFSRLQGLLADLDSQPADRDGLGDPGAMPALITDAEPDPQQHLGAGGLPRETEITSPQIELPSDLSHPGDPEISAIDLWTQVDLALERLRPGKKLVTNRDGSIAKVFGNEEVVQETVAVLITNAEMHGGSCITVRVDPLDDVLALSVIDDGPGLPLSVRAAVFGRDPSGGGGGLGRVRDLVRALGGDLSYDYRQGHSVFALTLPAV